MPDAGVVVVAVALRVTVFVFPGRLQNWKGDESDGQAVDWMMCSTLSWFSKTIVLFTPRTTVMCTG